MTAAFRVRDVVRRHALVPPEAVPLARYTFLRHHRTGAAAALTEPFSTGAPARAVLPVRVPVTAGGDSAVASTTLRLRGPGDVLALDPRQVVRRYPEPGVADAEPSDLVHVELDTPDLPWQFTPTGPDARGDLPPWLRLVVVRADRARWTPPRGDRLPVLEVPADELPPPEDAWAWAHVQVLGPPDGAPALAERLSGASPTTNVARLLSPRRLEAHTDWVAALVPVFDVGRLAGLRDPVPDGALLAWAWGSSAGPVRLPVYDSWRFATGADGDFEHLAERLRSVPPPDGVGRRRVDTSMPGSGVEPGAGQVRLVSGPLVKIGDPTTDGGAWPEQATAALQARVEGPDRFAHTPDADPEVGPPLYAGAHVARRTLPDAGDEPAWLRSLNLDPADRLVAGLGTRVVQMDQEALMTSAWAQVEGVVAANAALSAAALGRFVGAALHRRTLARMAPADLLGATARSHARLREDDDRPLSVRVAASALPTAAAGPVLRRLARPGGPVARFAGADVASRVAATRTLRVDEAGATRSWVRDYAEPDGVRTVEPSTLRALLEVLAEETEELAQLADELAQSAFVETVSSGRWDAGDLPRGLAQVAAVRELEEALSALLAALPTPHEVHEDPREHAPVVGDLVVQVLAVLRTGARKGIDRWSLPEHVARRHELEEEPDPDRPGRVLTSTDRVQGLLEPVWGAAGQYVEVREPRPDGELLGRLTDLLEPQDERLGADLVRLQEELGVDAPRLGDVARDVLAVADLRLVERLDPRRTAVARVRDRVVRWPGWLRGDHFDDSRLERVMVAPRFRHPMHEALDRYDREWLLPGVGAVQPQEVVTLLQTNARFVEAFLVGLNHELARELLWREYPTDGRATSFRSFWTTADELTAPVHALGPGPLGSHLDAAFDGATVLLVRGELVRRYPDLLVHAVQQGADGMPPALTGAPASTLFRLHLAPDLLLVGLRLSADAVVAQDSLAGPPKAGAWWFTLSEHVGQPRFGLDEGPGGVLTRDELSWADVPLAGGRFLRAAALPFVAPLPAVPQDAALVAWTLFQQPARVAFRGARMIGGMR